MQNYRQLEPKKLATARTPETKQKRLNTLKTQTKQKQNKKQKHIKNLQKHCLGRSLLIKLIEFIN